MIATGLIAAGVFLASYGLFGSWFLHRWTAVVILAVCLVVLAYYAYRQFRVVLSLFEE